MIKYVFFDFNGTLINDVDLCLDILNEFLREQHKKELSLEEYKDVFTFPIRDYYIASGIDFNIESYESLSVRFIKKYQPASLSVGLYSAVMPTIKALKDKGIKLYILSASEKNNLIEQCVSYGIDKYFDDILGIDNIKAGSKVDIAVKFMKENNINKKEAVFIGDTLHDQEVANRMGIDCRLVSCGHQSMNVLSKSGLKIYPDVSGILSEV